MSARSQPPPHARPLEAAEVAALLEVDLPTLDQWAGSHALTPVHDAEGRPLYIMADVLQFMVDTNRTQKADFLPAPRSPGSAGPQHDHQVAVAEAAFEAKRTLAAVETARRLVEEAAARALEERVTAGRRAAKLVADAAARDAVDTHLLTEAAVARLRNASGDDSAANELAKEASALAALVAREVAARADQVADTRHALDRAIAAEVAATAAAVALRARATAHVVADEVAARLALDEIKTQLFASVIHELRTPMTSITAQTELLQDGDLTAKQQERLDAIERNALRVATLVDDLLRLSSLEQADEDDHLDVDMCEVLNAARAAWQLLDDDRVEVSFEAPSRAVMVRGDVRSLESLVSNLVTNAVKFTGEGGWVRCTLEQREGCAHLEVSDNGIGIPEAEQQLLFTRFFRSSTSREKAIPGTGLGLAIVQSILARHGGTISVDSPRQQGTTVLVDLPLISAQDHPAAR